ncbi:hypothetical protein ACKKBF_B00270 [Auxenochlorella protothecoides x Auxenochlorella symbiontica]|uniref:Major facilitator superfamily associated domain-containing protein n=2 Tax=Auxenochlorella protothecoides TaxID=3075 RepID=A0A1D2AB96_AUXPR
MRPKQFLAAQIWYGVSGGAPTFILPFLNIFYSDTLKFSAAQIGLLAAIRPWVSAPCGSIIAGLADRGRRHAVVLTACYLMATLVQGAMALAGSFPLQLLLTLLASAVWAPPQIISDACVMAASTSPGDYGRIRSLASLAWSVMAPVAGFVNGRWGIRAGIAAYTALALAALPAALNLPLEALQGSHGPASSSEAPGPKDVEDLHAPLLPPGTTEQEPPSPKVDVEAPRSSALASALAIVRYIESITEMGLVAPTPGLYGFAEVSGPFMQRHLAPPELVAGFEAEEEAQREASRHVEPASPSRLPTIREAPSQRSLPLPAESLPRDERTLREAASLLSASVPAALQRQPSLPRPISLGNLRGAGRAQRHVLATSEGPHASHWAIEESEVEDGDDEASYLTGQESGRDSDSDPAGSVQSAFPWSPRSGADTAAGPTPLFDLSRHESDVGDVDAALARPTQGLPALGSRKSSANAPLPPFKPAPVVAAPQAEDSKPGPDAGALGTTPATGYRAAALERLSHLFKAGEDLSDVGGGETSEAPTPSGAGALTPVRRYIDYRKGMLRGAAEGQASALPCAPRMPPSTPPLLPSLPGSLAAAQAAIAPATMREAVRLEGASAPDAAGSYIINMLEGKLRRLARQARAERRAAQRAQRERQRARQAVAAGGESGAGEARDGPASTGPVPTDSDTASAADKAGLDSALVMELAPPGPPPSISLLLRDPEVVFFFVLTTVMGLGHGLIGSYLFMFIKHTGGSEALMGGVLMANALPELPVFFFFGRIAQRCTMTLLLFASCGVLALRLLLFPLLPLIGVRWVLAIETLHGITFALGWSACAMNSSKIAPPGLESTTQAIFQGLWTGVGTGLGGLVGGLLYHSQGPAAMFFAAGCLVAGASTLCALGMAWHRARVARASALLRAMSSANILAA